ncbi:hypothetical protein MRX96_056979 [Rhipicephalus microplus]
MTSLTLGVPHVCCCPVASSCGEGANHGGECGIGPTPAVPPESRDAREVTVCDEGCRQREFSRRGTPTRARDTSVHAGSTPQRRRGGRHPAGAGAGAPRSAPRHLERAPAAAVRYTGSSTFIVGQATPTTASEA